METKLYINKALVKFDEGIENFLVSNLSPKKCKS